MKIYTKQGDQGQTELPEYGRIDKDHLSLKTIGAVDELNSLTGLLKTHVSNKNVIDQLEQIQSSLFALGAHLANNRVNFNDVTNYLETQIDKMSASLPPLTRFILPGGAPAAAIAHVCRSVCRRAEINLVTLHKDQKIKNGALSFINRLSDYFFTLARLLNQQSSVADTIWKATNNPDF